MKIKIRDKFMGPFRCWGRLLKQNIQKYSRIPKFYRKNVHFIAPEALDFSRSKAIKPNLCASKQALQDFGELTNSSAFKLIPKNSRNFRLKCWSKPPTKPHKSVASNPCHQQTSLFFYLLRNWFFLQVDIFAFVTSQTVHKQLANRQPPKNQHIVQKSQPEALVFICFACQVIKTICLPKFETF